MKLTSNQLIGTKIIKSVTFMNNENKLSKIAAGVLFVSISMINIAQVKAATFMFEVMNTTGKPINDYHVSILGTGGNITNPMLVNLPQGSIDSGQINPNLIGQKNNPMGLPTDIIIDFTNPIPAPGKFKFKFDLPDGHTPVLDVSIFTDNGKPVGQRKHKNVVPNEVKEFKVDPEIAPIPSTLENELGEAIEKLFNEKVGVNFIKNELNVDGNIELFASLVNLPTLDDSSIFQEAGFTEIHLVFQDEFGSNSGIDLGILTQGGFTSFELNPSLFEPFGGFNEWQLGYSVFNPDTNQHILALEDQPVPEPATILGTATALGFGALLKRKNSNQSNKSKQKD